MKDGPTTGIAAKCLKIDKDVLFSLAYPPETCFMSYLVSQHLKAHQLNTGHTVSYCINYKKVFAVGFKMLVHSHSKNILVDLVDSTDMNR